MVDDQVEAAEALAELLEDDGHETVVARDGPAALAAVGSFDPEIVLLDLGLPEMDGYEVARRLRKAYPDKRFHLIALTGYQSDAARLEAGGFERHLLKPPNLLKLSELLAGLDGGA